MYKDFYRSLCLLLKLLLLPVIFFYKLTEGNQRSFHLFCVNAICHPEETGCAEGISGYQDQIIFQCLLAKYLGILLQSLGEDIEGSTGFNTGKAKLDQLIVKQVSVGLINA